MRRILFQWRGIKIYPYAFLLYVGIVLGILAGTYAGTVSGLDTALTCAAMILLVVPALIGARALYVVAHWNIYRANPSLIWKTWSGGAALYGGLVLALVCSAPLLAFMGLPLGRFWDAAAVTLAVGMAFTKTGCLLNGCCCGRETEGWLGLRLPNSRGEWRRRVPTQLLESAVATLVAFSALLLWNRLPFPGAFFLGSIAVYAIGRWLLEGTRENIDRAGRFSIYRAISLVLGTLCLTGLLLLSWHIR